MSSTASNILRFEKMATGENDATWGTKLNNIIDMIESAIAGVTSLSLSNVDVTLTNVDYTDDQAKKNVLYLSGTLSGNVNIIVPNKSKTYRVINNTSGAFTVGLKTSGGSAKLVTQGTAAELWCNASDVMFYTSPQTVFGTGAPNDASGAAASSVAVTPSGNLAATNAQAALVELQLDIDARQPLHANLTAIAGLAATKGNLIAGNGTNFVALGVGTDGYALLADAASATGAKWSSIMPATTIAPFQQTLAPTGWTKETTHNDKAFRVVSGSASSGGSTAFSTVFGARTISAAMLPDHTVTITDPGHVHGFTASRSDGNVQSGGGENVGNPVSSGNTSSATTGITAAFGTTARGGAQTDMAMQVHYVDLILAAKNAA
jgi:hypothetical protein